MSQLHPVFRPEKKGDRLRAAYVYPDSHVVVTFERYVRNLGADVTYAKIAQDVIRYTCPTTVGRLVFTAPEILAAALAAGAQQVRVVRAGIKHGSPNTRIRGLKIGYIGFTGGAWGDAQLTWYEVEGLSCGWVEQDRDREPRETYDASAKVWGNLRVVKNYPKKLPKPRDVIAIYDSETDGDRYTIVLDIDEGNGKHGCFGISEGLGISQYTSCQVGDHLGKRLAWDELPENIREHVIARCKES